MKTDKELIAEYKKLLQLEFPEDAAYLIIAAEDEILRRMALAGPQNWQGWVRVEDRLPEENQWVATFCANGHVAARPWNDWRPDYEHCGAKVTHWQPLSAPPTENAPQKEKP